MRYVVGYLVTYVVALPILLLWNERVGSRYPAWAKALVLLGVVALGPCGLFLAIGGYAVTGRRAA